MDMRIEVEITWITNDLEDWTQKRIFLNREHLKSYIEYLKESRGYILRDYHIVKAINPQTQMGSIEELEIDEDCEFCGGTGEVGPFGYEYPEYDTCSDCRGSGKQSGYPDPDRLYEEHRDRTL